MSDVDSLFSFYTMLYVDEQQKQLSQNNKANSFDSQIDFYIRCCKTLSQSLCCFTGKELTVLTNDAKRIRSIIDDLNIVEIPFNTVVPKKISFRAQHFKFDVFDYLAKQDEQCYYFLIDCDELCVNPLPENLERCIQLSIPVYYNILSQRYPLYSRGRIINDKDRINVEDKSIGIWCGGEFLGGKPSFYRLLLENICKHKENYFACYNDLHHQGDEVLLSIAIETLVRNGLFVCDAGSFGAIVRFWSYPPDHVQPSLEAYRNFFLIHMPSDKKFLANLSNVDEGIFSRYRKYHRWRYMLNKFVKFLKKRGLLK